MLTRDEKIRRIQAAIDAAKVPLAKTARGYLIPAAQALAVLEEFERIKAEEARLLGEWGPELMHQAGGAG